MATTSKKPKESKSQPQTIGQKLKQSRQNQGLSLKEVELATRIRGKYLVALESNNFAALPHDVYTKGFIQSYAEFLRMDPKRAVEQYSKERGDQPVQLRHSADNVDRGPVFSLRSLTLSGIALVALVVVGYLFWQFSALTAAPRLEVVEPDKDQVLYGSLITVRGKVGGGADVYVNDSPILSDANGNFSDSIALQDGVNAIRVTARNRLGKSTTLTRNILAHVPKADAAQELPAAPFDGVAVSLQIKDATAAVTVRSDGKEVFSGTMLPGSVKVFKASEKLNISTNNAGATLLTVTNLYDAKVVLGPSGSLGQERNNLEFTRDTHFQ